MADHDENMVPAPEVSRRRCSGNPAKDSCPVHRAYSTVDPDVNKYESLDCSVVVFEVKSLLSRLSDEQAMEEIRQGLAQCQGCAELVEMEQALRDKLSQACCEQAPKGLKERLLATLSGEACPDGTGRKSDEAETAQPDTAAEDKA